MNCFRAFKPYSKLFYMSEN